MNKLKLSLLFTVYFLATGTILAQRTVTGIIKDSVTGEAIIGAAVYIKQQNIGAITDADGKFELRNLPSADFILRVEFLSYKPRELEIGANTDVTDLEVYLEEETRQVGQIVVSGRMRSNTENSMVATVKNLSQVASGISAGQIARTADSDASEVVRRIPGITIIDNRFVIIRGLSQRYNNAWINGMSVPSTETDSRSFSFDILPSAQIDNIIVYKSPAPEIPADFAGGFVKVTTKTVPDRNSISVGYATGINVHTHFNSFYSNPGSATDWLGFDLSHRRLGKEVPAHLGTITDPARITDLTKNSFNNDWSIKKRSAVPDQKFNFTFAKRRDTKHGGTLGNITALNYSYANKSIRNIKNSRYGVYSASTDSPQPIDDYTDQQYTNDVRLGLLQNISLETSGGSTYEFKNIVNVLGRDRLTFRKGIKHPSSLYYREQTEYYYSSRLTYSGQLAGRHDLRRYGTLSWSAGYSYANRNEPDRRIVEYEEGIGSIEDIANVVVSNDNTKRYFQSLKDHTVSASADHKVELGNGRVKPVLKTGLFVEYTSRDYKPREFIYQNDNIEYEERIRLLKLPVGQMLARKNLGYDKFYLQEITNKTYAYSADLNLQAFYAALQIPLRGFDIYVGARAESYNMTLSSDKSLSPNIKLPTSRKHSSLDILPSANISYSFNDQHLVRAAYGASLNRPEMREVSPSVYYDFDLFNEIGGNENLKTAYIHNVDFRYEYYPSRGEIISIGFFYKNFKDPIEWTYIDMGGTLRYNYENARSADSYGIEIDIRKNFDFFGWDNLSMVVNAAFIESNVKFHRGELSTVNDRPMQGQSPYVVNAGLFYGSARLGLEVTVLYNRIGKRIVGIGKTNTANADVSSIIPDSYEMPRNSLDVQVSKTLGKRIDLKISVKDLLSENVVYKQFPRFSKQDDGSLVNLSGSKLNGLLNTHKREQVTKRYNPGQTIQVGLSVKL